MPKTTARARLAVIKLLHSTQSFKYLGFALYPRTVTRLLEHLAGETGEREVPAVETATDLKFVGPATGKAIDGAGFTAEDIVEKSVSYSMLLEAGVNPGVAAKIRRFLSLSWSFETNGDLNRRSEQVRGLQDDERAWVAESGIGDDTDEDSTTPAAEPPTSQEADDEAAWVENASREHDESSADGGESDDAKKDADEETAWVADSGAGSSSTSSATADGSGDPLAAEAAWRERSKPTPLTEVSGIDENYNGQLAEAGVTSVRSLATASPELLSDVTDIPERKLQKWHHEASRLAD